MFSKDLVPTSESSVEEIKDIKDKVMDFYPSVTIENPFTSDIEIKKLNNKKESAFQISTEINLTRIERLKIIFKFLTPDSRGKLIEGDNSHNMEIESSPTEIGKKLYIDFINHTLQHPSDESFSLGTLVKLIDKYKEENAV